MVLPRSDGSLAAREQGPSKKSTILGLRVAGLTPVLLWLVFPVTLGLAITRQSLWMDEGYTAWFVSRDSFASFFSALIGEPGAPGDPQMLFYHLYMWGWVKLFSASEIALRAANIPFALLYIGTMCWASRRLLRKANLWVFFCLSPFFWFYLNEARPYTVLVAFSSVATVSLLAYLTHPNEYNNFAPWACLISLFLAWGTHILAAFMFPSIVVLAAATILGDLKVRRNFLRDWYRPALWCLPAFIALAAFYIYVAPYGVNTTKDREPGLLNIARVLYEFSGFGGLGPRRGDLGRTRQIYAFVPYWPWLLVGFVAMLGVALFALRTRPPRIVWYLLSSLAVGMALALKFCRIEHFNVVARHMTALFPMFLISLMLWSSYSLSSKLTRPAAIASLVVLGFVWGISDARLVFLRKYEKDSYREASSIAATRALLDGGRILWAADPRTAHYYGIQVMRGQVSAESGKGDGLNWRVNNQAVDARNWSLQKAQSYLDTSKMPIILVLGRVDDWDAQGVWRALVQQRSATELARLNGIMIYEWGTQSTTIEIPNFEANGSVPPESLNWRLKSDL